MRTRTPFYILFICIILVVGSIGRLFLLHDWRAVIRDAQRVQDAEAIAAALHAYKKEHGTYPCEDDGVNGEVGVGKSIDQALSIYRGSIPKDPRSDGRAYGYYFDAAHGCFTEDGYSSMGAVMVAEFETERYKKRFANLQDICPGTWGAEGPQEPDYVIPLSPACIQTIQ